MKQIKLKTELNVKQNLVLSTSMKQAFEVLQMPVLELDAWVEGELEKNPVLEAKNHSERSYSSSSFLSEQKKAYLESLLSYPMTLAESLLSQARLYFQSPEDLQKARLLIENLDERGFLNVSLETLDSNVTALKEILAILQTFDPVGVGAQNVQECLLIQLRYRKKQTTLAYQIVLHHYEDLIQGRYQEIAQTLRLPKHRLRNVIEEDIAPLSPYPATKFSSFAAPPLIPDLTLEYRDFSWEVTLHSSYSHLYLSPGYIACYSDLKSEEKRFVQKCYTQGKWLLRMLYMREDLLRKIALYLIEKQGPFLAGETSDLSPLRIDLMAETLGVHPSTAARAVQNKYVACPRGVFLIKLLFPRSHFEKEGKSWTSDSVKHILKQMILEEDLENPLSDSSLEKKLQEKGITCARRTIAKYRKLLNIPHASKRGS